MHHAEDRCVRSDAERHDDYGNGCESGTFGQVAQGKLQVLEKQGHGATSASTKVHSVRQFAIEEQSYFQRVGRWASAARCSRLRRSVREWTGEDSIWRSN